MWIWPVWLWPTKLRSVGSSVRCCLGLQIHRIWYGQTPIHKTTTTILWLWLYIESGRHRMDVYLIYLFRLIPIVCTNSCTSIIFHKQTRSLLPNTNRSKFRYHCPGSNVISWSNPLNTNRSIRFKTKLKVMKYLDNKSNISCREMRICVLNSDCFVKRGAHRFVYKFPGTKYVIRIWCCLLRKLTNSEQTHSTLVRRNENPLSVVKLQNPLQIEF